MNDWRIKYNEAFDKEMQEIINNKGSKMTDKKPPIIEILYFYFKRNPNIKATLSELVVELETVGYFISRDQLLMQLRQLRGRRYSVRLTPINVGWLKDHETSCNHCGARVRRFGMLPKGEDL